MSQTPCSNNSHTPSQAHKRGHLHTPLAPRHAAVEAPGRPAALTAKNNSTSVPGAPSTANSDLTCLWSRHPYHQQQGWTHGPHGAAPEGFALDAHTLGQAAQEGRRTLLHHMVHTQPPLDILQQPPQEAQEVLSSTDGAWHGLCRETESAGTGGTCEGQRQGRGRAHLEAPHRAAQGWPGVRLSPLLRWPPAAPLPGAGTHPSAAAHLSP